MARLSLLCRIDRAEDDETTLARIAFVENAARAEPKLAIICLLFRHFCRCSRTLPACRSAEDAPPERNFFSVTHNYATRRFAAGDETADSATALIA
jgi:hypothetical protein